MKRFAVLLLALAACDPQVMVDKTIANTAQVVVSDMIGSEAATCVVNHADPAELAVLARDVGVRAGTRTKAIVRGILARPDTQTCLTRAKVTPPDPTGPSLS
jgi:hypothetical protein